MKHMIRKILEPVNLYVLGYKIYNKCKYLIDFHTQFQNTRLKNQGAPDDLPVPSPQLVFLVTGQHNIESFYHNGLQGAECIKSILEKNRLDINAFKSILDFGCGCGRIMRHWKTLRGPKLYGTDYNPVLVNWCQKNLTFAEFKINMLSSKLEYEDEKFDFIFAISVFTHLAEDLQNFWISELTRILKPDGFLLITVHGTTRFHQLSLKERQEFESGQLVVYEKKYPGTNCCSAYHPEQYVRQSLAKRLTVVDFVPGGAKDANQDAFLLQKTKKSDKVI